MMLNSIDAKHKHKKNPNIAQFINVGNMNKDLLLEKKI